MPYQNVRDNVAASLPIGRYNQFLEMLLSGESLESLLYELALLIQEKQPDCQASILLLSDDGKRLIHGAAPSLPDYYTQAVHNLEIGEGVGACGSAAATGHLTITDDIQRHPNWQNFPTIRALAAQAGLRACWSQAILSSTGTVLGAFAMYYSDVRFPSGTDLLLIHEAARLAQASIEYHRAHNHRRLTATISQHLPIGLMITDADFNIIEVNPSLSTLTGFSCQELLGKAPHFIISSKFTTQFEDIISHLPAQKSWTTEVLIQHRNGERFHAELCFSAVRDAEGKIERCIALVSDISDRKRSEQTIQYQANYDILTNLPNRNLFYDRLTWMIEQARHKGGEFSVMLMDLDYFKEINDTLGHDAGDELLVKIGKRLQDNLDDGDLVARLGGDEFGILIQGHHSNEELEARADHLLYSVSRSVAIRQMNDCRMSASLGISRYPQDGSTLEQLLKSAEQALYATKNEGRDGFKFFSPAMQEEAEVQASLHQELRYAVANNQLVLHYQPVKSLGNSHITHVEALVRWNNPQRGMIRPDIFIPLAEKTGLIREIGHWVREEALAMIRRLKNYGIDICVAVNVSTAEFYDRDLAAKIVEQVEKAQVPRGSFMVEITESLLIRNQQETLSFLLTLQAAGIRVALDDFGTGYSSLSYLSAFPADKLKIDRSFILDMGNDNRKQALVDTIITLGHSLNMTVIAEGVETEADEHLLKIRNCDSIQGYLLAKPLTEWDLLCFLTDYPSGIVEAV